MGVALNTNRPKTADIVDLQRRRVEAALASYADAVDAIFSGEAAFFTEAKFTPFARSYIASDFAPELEPRILLAVRVRDDRPGAEARHLIARLKRQGFSYRPGLMWAKGARPKSNPNQDPWGPELEREITLEAARALFAERDKADLGRYQRSAYGFRATHRRDWDEHGVGFSIVVQGHDDRRRDAYGHATTQESHIVDSEDDLAELVDMAALIARAKIDVVESSGGE